MLPSYTERQLALNHHRPIIEGVLAPQRHLVVPGAPREIGRTSREPRPCPALRASAPSFRDAPSTSDHPGPRFFFFFPAPGINASPTSKTFAFRKGSHCDTIRNNRHLVSTTEGKKALIEVNILTNIFKTQYTYISGINSIYFRERKN